jgi:hypothetical protein
LLSSTDASGWGVLARLIVPFFAAGAWELLLTFERRRTGRRTINWRISPERVLVRLGLAEATGRTAGEVDTHRRITRVALAAHRLRVLQGAGAWDWRLRRASRHLNAAVRAAVEYADLASDEARQDELMAQLAVLNGAVSLAEVSPLAPWNRPDPTAVLFDTARVQFAPLIAGAIGTGTVPEPAATDRYEEPADTGTEQAANSPLETGTDKPAQRPQRAAARRRRNGRRRTGTKTGPKARTEAEKAALLDRARELNADHMRDHGRPISGDKLATALHVSKGTALDLLREVKRLREVRSDDGAA